MDPGTAIGTNRDFIETAHGQSGKSSGQLEEAGQRLSFPTLLVRVNESDVLTEDGISAFGQAVPMRALPMSPERVTWRRAIVTTASQRSYNHFSQTSTTLH